MKASHDGGLVLRTYHDYIGATDQALVYRTIPTAPIGLDEVTLFIACPPLSPMVGLLRRTKGAPTELMCDDWLALCDTFYSCMRTLQVRTCKLTTWKLGWVVDLEIRWVVFDDLFTSRRRWAAGGERSHYNMVCATLDPSTLSTTRAASRSRTSWVPCRIDSLCPHVAR